MKKIYFFLIVSIFMVVLVNSENNESFNRKVVCSDLYFSILESDWAINETYFENKYNINFTEFVENYPEDCQAKYNLDELPLKKEIPIWIIDKTKTDCDLDLNKFLGASWNFFDIHINSMSCKSAKVLNYFFELEDSNSYTIKRIRIVPLASILLLIIILQLFRSNSYINKLIEKHDRNT